MTSYLFYLFTIGISVIFAYLADKYKYKKNDKYFPNKIFYYISMLNLIFVLGLRVETGVDYYSYERIFNTVSDLGFFGYYNQGNIIEPGYVFLNYLVSFFNLNYNFLLFITAFITIYFFYKAISYEIENISFALAIFIFSTTQYFYYFGIVRLGIAAAIVAYALRFIKENNKKKFILYALIASLFHYSALSSLILIFINFNKEERITKRNIFLIVIIIPFSLFVGRMLLEPILGSFSRYSNYFDKDITIFNFATIIYWIPFLILFSIYYINIKSYNKFYHFYFVIYIIRIFMDGFGGIIGISRMMWYFNISLVILLPATIKKSKNLLIKYILLSLVIAFSLYYCYYSYFSSESHRGDYMIPYKSIFFELDD